MAHPDTTAQGNEKGQREHAGRDSEASDAGMQRTAQNLHGEGPTPVGGAGDSAGRAGAAGGGEQERGDATPAAHGAAAAAGAAGEATAPSGDSRSLEGHPAIADRGLKTSSPDAAAGAPGGSPPR